MTGSGLTGRYYSGRNFNNLVLTRTDSTIDFNWDLGSPDALIAANNFSVVWSGKIHSLYSEPYTFYTQSDEGVRLWVNGELLIDNWRSHRTTEDSGTITLTANQLYDIRLEYYDLRDTANLQLSWSSTSQTKEIIPQSQLYSTTDPLPGAGTLQLSATDYSVTEDGLVATITIERTDGSDGAVSALLNLVDGTATAADDYDNTAIAVNFAAGETQQTIDIPISDDSLAEADETLTLTLASPTGGASIGDQNTAIVTIIDNDSTVPPATGRVFPEDLGFVNVKDYGAVGDGITDDTAAILQAMAENKALYFPDGTYLIKRALNWGEQARRGLVLQGQSQTGTILKLADYAPDFQNPNQPLPFISFFEGISTGIAFGNSVSDLTLDVGTGNPGAVGLSFVNNNQGGIENVTIRSSDPNYSGHTGLALTQPWPGPGLVKNVTISGFDFGMQVRHAEYGMVFENLALDHQRIVGIRNVGNVLSIHGLTSQNTVPVIESRNAGSGIITLVDATLTGGSGNASAIQMFAGTLYARNVSTSGYRSAISNNGVAVPGTFVHEYVSNVSQGGQIFSLFPTAQTSLNLPIEDTPTIQYDDLSQWMSVTEFGAIPDDGLDDTQAIQQALDSGYSTIYLPAGAYTVSSTLTVGDSVKMITGVGYSSEITVANPLRSQDLPVFRFVGDSQEVTVLEHLRGTLGLGGDYHWIEHASSKTLVVRHFTAAAADAYRNTGTGRLFLEDVVGSGWVFDHQQVWARQLNAEGTTTKIINNGGTLWILGLKTEQSGTIVETTNGGQTEILGGLIYPAGGANDIPSDQPAFINNESSLSIVGVGESRYLDGTYNILVEDTQNGVTQTLFHDDSLLRGMSGFLLPLYTSSHTDGDTLVGDAAANVLQGGADSDMLTGGGGADTFVYTAAAEGLDTITDFDDDDLLQISASGFGGNLIAGAPLSTTAMPTGTFVSGIQPLAISSDPHFLYDTETGILRFDLDGFGAGAAVAIAQFQGAPTLTTSQFAIVA